MRAMKTTALLFVVILFLACGSDRRGFGADVDVTQGDGGPSGFGKGDDAAALGGCDGTESNAGCEFWAVDLDLDDLPTDPASAPWALVLASASDEPAKARIERNDAPPGAPLSLATVWEGTVAVNDLAEVKMPTREVDCGSKPNDHKAPGTCLSSNAFRVRSTAPIVVYQFNNVVHNFATDASLLLPTPVLGKTYRTIGWGSGSPFPSPVAHVQRAYVTIVGTEPGTTVSVSPAWRLRGNGPIAATPKGGVLTMTIGPFDVLNLEGDDATIAECTGPKSLTPPYCSDLTGTIVQASRPVAVFSGTESSGVAHPDAPKPPSWSEESGCCKQHLEEQLPPLHAAGRHFVVTRSPVRSTNGTYEEPDVLRFVGAAEPSHVTTTLPAPLDSFDLAPGAIVDTWTNKDVVVSASHPILVAQFLVIQDYVEGTHRGDPSFTVIPPVEQSRDRYVFLSPPGWDESWVVVNAPKGTDVTIDGKAPSKCIVKDAGLLEGKTYEARRCPLAPGVHRLNGNGAFGIMAYGYGSADAYAFAGGTFVKRIYDPPPLK